MSHRYPMSHSALKKSSLLSRAFANLVVAKRIKILPSLKRVVCSLALLSLLNGPRAYSRFSFGGAVPEGSQPATVDLDMGNGQTVEVSYNPSMDSFVGNQGNSGSGGGLSFGDSVPGFTQEDHFDFDSYSSNLSPGVQGDGEDGYSHNDNSAGFSNRPYRSPASLSFGSVAPPSFELPDFPEPSEVLSFGENIPSLSDMPTPEQKEAEAQSLASQLASMATDAVNGMSIVGSTTAAINNLKDAFSPIVESLHTQAREAIQPHVDAFQHGVQNTRAANGATERQRQLDFMRGVHDKYTEQGRELHKQLLPTGPMDLMVRQADGNYSQRAAFDQKAFPDSAIHGTPQHNALSKWSAVIDEASREGLVEVYAKGELLQELRGLYPGYQPTSLERFGIENSMSMVFTSVQSLNATLGKMGFNGSVAGTSLPGSFNDPGTQFVAGGFTFTVNPSGPQGLTASGPLLTFREEVVHAAQKAFANVSTDILNAFQSGTLTNIDSYSERAKRAILTGATSFADLKAIKDGSYLAPEVQAQLDANGISTYHQKPVEAQAKAYVMTVEEHALDIQRTSGGRASAEDALEAARLFKDLEVLSTEQMEVFAEEFPQGRIKDIQREIAEGHGAGV